MLWARSVAVVGASPRRPSLGNRVMTELAAGEFAGRVIPVNPGHTEVEGIDAAASLLDLDEPVDLAILAVADARLEEQLGLAIDRGVGGVVIFSPCQGTASDGSSLRDRLAAMATEAGVPVCGPNGMGFVNVEHGLRATGFYQPPRLEPGGVAFLSHSGSLFSAMLHNRRRLRFNLVVSTGQEIATTMDAYLNHVLDLDSTRAVGLFLETIRDPAAMADALTTAAERDIPVVALKVGRSERGAAAAATHSGAMAGEDAAYGAFFAAHGVHRVETMDEMADTLELFSTGLRARRGALGSVHDSGGERTLLIDMATDLGVPLAVVSSDTRARIAAVLDSGLEPDNPVDAWGTGHDHEDIFETSIRALADDPAVGVVAFAVDLTSEGHPADGYMGVVEVAHRDLPVPLAVLANLTSGIDPDQADLVRSLGVPVLEGTRSGLLALRHLLDHAHRHRSPAAPPPGPDDEVRERWRTRLGTGEALRETEGLDLLADYGIEVVARRTAATRDEALSAAEALGYPLALKTGHAGHKTDVGGIRLGLKDRAAVEAAYNDLSSRLGPEVTVQAMAPLGVEVALGIVNDAQFGPLVMVGAGGTLVELLGDRALAVPPLDSARATRLVEGLDVARLLSGVRGAQPAHRGALIEAVVALSVLALDLGDLLAGLDVNPVIVSPHGAVAVDALVIPKVRP